MDWPSIGLVVPIVAAVVASAITAAVTFALQKRRRLGFLLGGTKDLTAELSRHLVPVIVRVGPAEISQLNRATVGVKNIGNVAIADVTFDIMINGPHNFHLADVQAKETSLRQEVRVAEWPDKRNFNPIYRISVSFLNPGESFSIVLLFDGDAVECGVSCRMPDVTVRMGHAGYGREAALSVGEGLGLLVMRLFGLDKSV
jgi:hypothetical protein